MTTSQPLPPFHVPARAERDLGLLEVRALLRSLCSSPYGREAVDEDPFPGTLAAVEQRVDMALEARRAVERKVAPDFVALKEVRPTLDAVEKGVVLGAIEILDVAKTMDGLARLHDVVTFQGEEAPLLVSLAEPISVDRRFYKRVMRSFDDQGQLTDDASPELAQLRGKVRGLRSEATEKLEGLVKELDDAGQLRDRNFTLRNDRYVLPVKSEFQGRVEGIVHDASQTGQTVFIEPRALLQIGNRIKIARAEVIEEEQRILRELSLEVGEKGPELMADTSRAGVIEAAFARGAFAARTDLRKPRYAVGDGDLALVAARHPLLAWLRADAIARGEAPPPVVGNDIGFGGRQALVVTGPNAGGKTVALKTVGIVALMARAGLPVPCHEDSRVPLFAAVLATVGDEQSLGEALSSFSGHLVALRSAIDEVDASLPRGPVLCLLDELLSGTDPSQGAALAQALLEHLVDRGAFVVATTHYERLKALAIIDGDDHRRFRNASVALEPGTGRPTFSLHLDQVGTSNAMEAARRYGLKEAIVARAQSLLAPDERDLHQMLTSLAEKNAAVERRLAEAEAEKARFEAESRRLEKRLADVERESQRLRSLGMKAFLEELKDARKVVAEAIEAAKGGADPRTLNKASHDLSREEEKAKAHVEGDAAPRSDLLRPQSVKVGDTIEVVNLPGNRLSVLEVDGDDVVVGKGILRMRVSLDALRQPGAEAKKKERAQGHTAPAPVPEGSRSEPRTTDNTLDVRGQRVDEMLELLDAFLDRLLRQGKSRAFVLHGHGGGALKKAVRGALAESRYVAKHAPADERDGGDGVTEVTMKDDARL